ncbi:hypothetical protein DENSPDRAFT_882499 [Dentipellis sp. KUC8613]|nr:hypothetical protein DENSPDRAFT_882499 [Dentipellis sp. KUC8613]
MDLFKISFEDFIPSSTIKFRRCGWADELHTGIAEARTDATSASKSQVTLDLNIHPLCNHDHPSSSHATGAHAHRTPPGIPGLRPCRPPGPAVSALPHRLRAPPLPLDAPRRHLRVPLGHLRPTLPSARLAAPSQRPAALSAPHRTLFAHSEAVLHATPLSARRAATSVPHAAICTARSALSRLRVLPRTPSYAVVPSWALAPPPHALTSTSHVPTRSLYAPAASFQACDPTTLPHPLTMPPRAPAPMPRAPAMPPGAPVSMSCPPARPPCPLWLPQLPSCAATALAASLPRAAAARTHVAVTRAHAIVACPSGVVATCTLAMARQTVPSRPCTPLSRPARLRAAPLAFVLPRLPSRRPVSALAAPRAPATTQRARFGARALSLAPTHMLSDSLAPSRTCSPCLTPPSNAAACACGLAPAISLPCTLPFRLAHPRTASGTPRYPLAPRGAALTHFCASPRPLAPSGAASPPSCAAWYPFTALLASHDAVSRSSCAAPRRVASPCLGSSLLTLSFHACEPDAPSRPSSAACPGNASRRRLAMLGRLSARSVVADPLRTVASALPRAPAIMRRYAISAPSYAISSPATSSRTVLQRSSRRVAPLPLATGFALAHLRPRSHNAVFPVSATLSCASAALSCAFAALACRCITFRVSVRCLRLIVLSALPAVPSSDPMGSSCAPRRHLPAASHAQPRCLRPTACSLGPMGLFARPAVCSQSPATLSQSPAVLSAPHRVLFTHHGGILRPTPLSGLLAAPSQLPAVPSLHTMVPSSTPWYHLLPHAAVCDPQCHLRAPPRASMPHWAIIAPSQAICTPSRCRRAPLGNLRPTPPSSVPTGPSCAPRRRLRARPHSLDTPPRPSRARSCPLHTAPHTLIRGAPSSCCR